MPVIACTYFSDSKRLRNLNIYIYIFPKYVLRLLAICLKFQNPECNIADMEGSSK